MSEYPRIVIDEHIVTVPVSDAAQDAINDFIREHQEELDRVLAPHHLVTTDLIRPVYERRVRIEDIQKGQSA